MKFTQFAQCFHATAVPFAFLMASAMTEFGCAGADRQTPPPQQADQDDYGGSDPYEHMCDYERRRGNDCPTKEEWYRKHGLSD